MRDISGVRCLVLAVPLATWGVIAAAAPADADMARIQAQQQAHPDDVPAMEALAEALLRRARVSFDARDTARAESLIQRALELAPTRARTWTLRAWSEMSAHRFAEALISLHKAEALGAHDAATLGLEADALVELGRYAAAVDVTQQMLDRYPGLPSYSRAAYLRFLHGDLAGAIFLTQKAVAAGRPGTEETAWTLLQLSELLLHNGQAELAEHAARAAEKNFPGLAQTQAHLARVKLAQGDFHAALTLFQQTAKIQMSPEYAFAAWQVAIRLDDKTTIKREAALLAGMAKLDTAGLYKRLFADYYAEQPEYRAEAERLAREELAQRPDIYSQGTLAWALYRAGKITEARPLAEQALRLDTADIGLRYRMGVILSAAGDAERGGMLMREALLANPYLASPLVRQISTTEAP